MDRRTLLGTLAGGISGINSTTMISPKTRCLVLTLKDDVDLCDDNIREIKRSIREALDKAGCPDVQFILLTGLDVEIIEW